MIVVVWWTAVAQRDLEVAIRRHRRQSDEKEIAAVELHAFVVCAHPVFFRFSRLVGTLGVLDKPAIESKAVRHFMQEQRHSVHQAGWNWLGSPNRIGIEPDLLGSIGVGRNGYEDSRQGRL